MKLRTCVDPSGKFVYGRHQPCFTVANLRENDYIGPLGRFADGAMVDNQANFPPGDVDEPAATMIYEIPNPFPFRGVTYISENWAAKKAKDPSSIMLSPPKAVSFTETLEKWFGKNQLTPEKKHQIFNTLPASLNWPLRKPPPTGGCRLAGPDLPANLWLTQKPAGLTDFCIIRTNPVQSARYYGRPLYEVIANNPPLARCLQTGDGVNARGAREKVKSWKWTNVSPPAKHPCV
ncbi:MAG: hypothetical protein R2860_09115 [Desulfobacterales bacterium]